MEIKLLSCPLCLKPHFDNVDALRSSLITVATSHLSCPVCSESLLGLDKLTIHLFGHITTVVQETTQNAIITSTETTEMNSSIPDEENIISKTLASTEVSTTQENYPENNLISCDICNFCFNDENILEMHQKLLHQTTPDKETGVYSYHCHLCSKKFKMKGSLMVHLRVAHYGFGHHDDADYRTKQLGNTTEVDNITIQVQRDKDSILDTENKQEKRVINSKVQDNKQWECDICSKMFTTKYFLKKHKRLHTGEMPYYCAQCNKYFTFQQSYHKHMLYHSTEKPHVCTECGRAFKELSTLHNHERIHSGERPFACETCGKCFRQRVSYLVHRRIHTGVMPYKCTACDKSFRYKVSQRSHKCTATNLETQDNNVQKKNSQTASSNQYNVQLIESCDSNIINSGNTFNILCSTLDINNPDYQIVSENVEQLNAEYIDRVTNKSLKINDITGKIRNEDVPAIANAMETEPALSKNTSVEENNGIDLFSMVLSPLIPDVQSLCLNNEEENSENKNQEILRTINEESFKELLYGCTKTNI